MGKNHGEIAALPSVARNDGNKHFAIVLAMEGGINLLCSF